MDSKLFHGLCGTNQGMHQRQPQTVLTAGYFHHSGNVLLFSDKSTLLNSTVRCKCRTEYSNNAHSVESSAALVFVTRGERAALMEVLTRRTPDMDSNHD
jgi:hypothetical protein